MIMQQLIVLHTEFTDLRGGEKYFYELIRRVSQKHAVSLYVENISPYWRERFNKSRANVYVLWKFPCCYWMLLPIALLINFIRLRGRVGEGSVVFATSFPLNYLAILLSKKTIVLCSEPLSIFYDSVRVRTMSIRAKLFVTIARVLYRPFDTYGIRHANVLATLNPHVASYIKNRYRRTPDVYLPNGVDHQIFSPVKRRVPHNRFILLHSTDYTTLKGTELLIRSMSRVVQRYSNIEVWISESVCNPTEKEKYISLVRSLHLEGAFRFVGTVSEKKLPSFYRSGDVFCYLGSPFCGGGSTASLSVIEAQSCGIPVLRSLGGNGEIVDQKTGYYIHDYSENGVAKEIVRFLRLPNSKKRMLSRAARHHSVKKFSWDKTANTLVSTINKLSYV